MSLISKLSNTDKCIFLSITYEDEWFSGVANVAVYLKKNDVLKYINKHTTESLKSVSTVHLNLAKTVCEANRSNQVRVGK